MAKPSTLPSQVFDHAPDQALAHLPTALPPVSTGPEVASQADVTLPQHALDQVEHIAPLGVSHLPDFFF
ncbi:hypothetical protein GGD63_001424 [Bradyrhizobium sp. cir1]|uniref:hypothetical protein n=1 Tax=Bradyrhizobium sp. cir1 TaxID=1445730 RepID=UPI001606CB8B|nr:hypothetical protein [Bradyrhizobium sp. cir1]MBB4368645.1 hypothetical protein [Bradyrhizobium sp. cir1]